jgi:hypothetical protein
MPHAVQEGTQWQSYLFLAYPVFPLAGCHIERKARITRTALVELGCQRSTETRWTDVLTDEMQFVAAQATPMRCSGPWRWFRRSLRTEVGHSRGRLVRLTVMNDGASVNRAELALIPRAAHVSRRYGHGAPSLCCPTRIIDSRGVVVTRDFTPNGPIQASDRRWALHRWFPEAES